MLATTSHALAAPPGLLAGLRAGANLSIDRLLEGGQVVLGATQQPLEGGLDVVLGGGCDGLLQVGDVTGLQVDTHLIGRLDRRAALGVPGLVELIEGVERVVTGRQPGRGVRHVIPGHQGADGVVMLLLGLDDHREGPGPVVLVGERLVQVAGQPLLLTHERQFGRFVLTQGARVGRG